MPYDKSPWTGTVPAGFHRVCACGESANKPFCDGSHGRTGSAKRPAVFQVEADTTCALCMCGRSAAAPRCDGSHKT